MKTRYELPARRWAATGLLIALTMIAGDVIAQPPGGGRGPGPGGPGDAGPRDGGPDRGGPGRGGPDRGGPGRREPGIGMMRMIPVMAALDANSDGEISAEEIANASEALRKLDKNGDGKLTLEELRPEFARRGPPDGETGPRGPRFRGERRPGPDGRPERDGRRERDGRTEGDGRPEGEAGPEREGRPGDDDSTRRRGVPDVNAMVDRWMNFDKDDDGKLSREELTAMLKSQMEQRREGGPGPGAFGRGGFRGRPERDGERGRDGDRPRQRRGPAPE